MYFEHVMSHSVHNMSHFLNLHHRLGHVNFPNVQSLLLKQPSAQRSHQKERFIQPTNNRASSIQPPMCAACQFAKQKRLCPPSSKKGGTTVEKGGISDNITVPGQCVAVDLYSSTARGRLPDTFGHEYPDL